MVKPSIQFRNKSPIIGPIPGINNLNFRKGIGGLMSYRTDDLFLAAFLVADGCVEFAGVVGNGAGRKAVSLSPEPSAEIINNFYRGNATVPALAYSEAYKRLVTSIRNTPVMA